MMQSTSYSTLLATTPLLVIRSTPLAALTSTSVTFGRLKVGRYSSLKVGRLQNRRYQGFRDSAVCLFLTTLSTRARIWFILRKSASSIIRRSRSSGVALGSRFSPASSPLKRLISVQPSPTWLGSILPPCDRSVKLTAAL